MKTWADLSDAQQTFITRYLKKSVKDLFRKREKSATNKAIIGAYGNYLDLKKLFDDSAVQVPDDYPQRAPIMALADTADTTHRAGKFDQAAAIITPAIPQMEQLRRDLTDAAEAARSAVVPAGEDGFAQSDKDEIETARRVILQLLADPLPTQEAMTAANAAKPDYDRAVRAATEAMADLLAATSALAQAKTLCAAMLAAAGSLDPTPYASTPQAAALAAAVQTAQALQREVASVPMDDIKSMRALTAKLEDFHTADEVTQLAAAALLALTTAVTHQFEQVRASLETGRDADLSRFSGEAEFAQMTTLQTQIKDDLAFINTQLASRDADDLSALTTRIDEAARRAVDLDTLQRTVGVRMAKADLASKGAKEAHQDGILRLMDTNKVAADKVVASLERNAALLGGQPATPDFLRAKKGEVETLQGEYEAANAANTAASVEYNRLDGLEQARIQELRQLVGQINATAPPIPTNLMDDYNDLRTDVQQLGTLKATALTDHQAKYAALTTKVAELNQAKTVLAAATTQRTMLDAITFGPLSPVAGRPIPDDMVADVVDLFDTNPALATQTCRLAATAKDPKKLAETAVYLAGQCETGFEWQPPDGPDGVTPPTKSMNTGAANNYAKQLLNRVAYFGPDFADQAQDAIARGIPFEQNTILRAAGSVTPKQTAGLRATEAAGAMMEKTVNADGDTVVKLALDGDAFKDVLDRQKFSADGQFQPSAMMNAEMDKLAAFFGDPTEGATRRAEAEAILNSVTSVPASPAARDLMHKSMGIPLADFDDPAKADEVKEKIQQGILKSMVTPVAQADVGSCFATAPLRKMRDDDPLAVMEMYRDIATTGTFKPKQGRPLPAVVNIPPGDDPLTRSLEYSVAAAGARLASSRERTNINAAVFGMRDPTAPSLMNVGSVLDSADWTTLQPQLLQAVAGGFSFTYDPLANASGTSNDGSSDKGFMRMIEADTQKPILSQAEFIAFIKRKSTEAVTAAGLPDTDRDKVLAYIDDPAFVASVDRMAGPSKPWDMSFGGFGDEAGDALFGHGGTKRSTDLVSKDSSDTTGDRAIKVLKSLGGLSNQGMTMVATRGMHSFNALPPEGAYKALLTGDVDANIQSMLVEPGRKIATTKLPRDRAVYLYDKQMEATLNQVSTDAERNLVRAAFGNRPTTDMTPAELESHISTQLDAVKTARADAAAQAWASAQTTAPSATELNAKKLAEKTAQDERFTKLATRTLTQELGVPEFVVADPNWGSEGDHNLFVIAPDPLTGEPKLWQKSVMSGGLWPLGDDWLKANWRVED